MNSSNDPTFYDQDEEPSDQEVEWRDRAARDARRPPSGLPGSHVRIIESSHDRTSETLRPVARQAPAFGAAIFADLKGDSRRLARVARLIEATDTMVESDRGCWELRDEHVLAWGFLTPGNGKVSEDAEPMLISETDNAEVTTLIGVFDGMGGAGASAAFNEGGPVHSEAYRASRVARAEVIAEWRKARQAGRHPGLDADVLASAIHDALKSAAARFATSGESRLKGSIKKSFPTTVACALVTTDKSGSGPVRVNVKVAWAGDSRVWVLTPTDGLQQLTADDSRLADCLEQLQQDPPLTNMATADRPFGLKHHLVAVDGPAIVVSATDGVSGYVRSPGDVEKVILDSFLAASSRGVSPAKAMSDAFSRTAADDVSAAVVSVGFASVDDINSAFSRRRSILETRYRRFRDEPDSGSSSEIRRAVWEEERDLYCALMPRGQS